MCLKALEIAHIKCEKIAEDKKNEAIRKDCVREDSGLEQ